MSVVIAYADKEKVIMTSDSLSTDKSDLGGSPINNKKKIFQVNKNVLIGTLGLVVITNKIVYDILTDIHKNNFDVEDTASFIASKYRTLPRDEAFFSAFIVCGIHKNGNPCITAVNSVHATVEPLRFPADSQFAFRGSDHQCLPLFLKYKSFMPIEESLKQVIHFFANNANNSSTVNHVIQQEIIVVQPPQTH